MKGKLAWLCEGHYSDNDEDNNVDPSYQETTTRLVLDAPYSGDWKKITRVVYFEIEEY